MKIQVAPSGDAAVARGYQALVNTSTPGKGATTQSYAETDVWFKRARPVEDRRDPLFGKSSAGEVVRTDVDVAPPERSGVHRPKKHCDTRRDQSAK